MAFWAVAQLQPQRAGLALHCLALNGFTTYLPRLREGRVVRQRRVETYPPLFPGYCFLVIQLQWAAARYAPGVRRLIMDGLQPARIPDGVIAEIRTRERRGLVELPPRLRRGEAVRILRGPFCEQLALYDGQTSRERVAVLLELLGGRRCVTLPSGDVEALR